MSDVRPEDIEARTRIAVRHFWQTREAQAGKQTSGGQADRGARSAVTGGAQMDGFIDLLAWVIEEAGAPRESIFRKQAIELPGFFRPSKQWDLLVVTKGQLVAALEAKSHIGPSFGNNFNNRTEEAMGSALDLWTAFREGVFNSSVRPWLGYLILLEDCAKSQAPLKVAEPHFKALAEFRRASYARRYELFCGKLVREGHYSSSCFLTARSDAMDSGAYAEPANDLGIARFVRSLAAHVEGNSP